MQIFNTDCLEMFSNVPENSIDCIVTDPPYGVGYKNDFYDDSEQTVSTQMPKWFAEFYRVLRPATYLYLFVGVKTIHKWIESGISAGFIFKNIIATRSFNNGAISPTNNFGFQFQPILVFSKGQGKAFNNVNFIPTSEEWLKDSRNGNPTPFTYQYPNWIETEWAYASAKNSTKSNHPNEKNTDLIQFLIEISTNKDDRVLDPFMGSGTTGVSCVRCKRDFIGCEIDNTYFKVAHKRLQKYLECRQESLV